jgi:hypothetical protein
MYNGFNSVSILRSQAIQGQTVEDMDVAPELDINRRDRLLHQLATSVHAYPRLGKTGDTSRSACRTGEDGFAATRRYRTHVTLPAVPPAAPTAIKR